LVAGVFMFKCQEIKMYKGLSYLAGVLAGLANLYVVWKILLTVIGGKYKRF